MRSAWSLVGKIVACSLLVGGGMVRAQITVTEAQVGCLDLKQNQGNLTAVVGKACNGKTACSFKAPTPQQYQQMGVHAYTRTFCTQAMEITYRCGSGGTRSVTVPGDAWTHAAAELGCEAPPPPPGNGQGQPPSPFPISKSQEDPINGIGYMHTNITITKSGNGSGQLAATTHTWSAKDLEGFHGSVAVAVLNQNRSLLWVSQTQSYGVDGKHVPFGGPSNRTDRWSDSIPAGALSQMRYVAIKQRWNPKAVTPDDIANWLKGVGNNVGNELASILQAVGTVGQDLESPTVAYTDARGYRYVETSDGWKKMCTAFPCFEGLHWPDYNTKVISTTINGQAVVVQLWKGYCEKFLGMERFPGGIGAEVGIYRREAGRARPTGLSFLPPQLATIFLNPMGKLADNDLWWAYPELNTQLTFRLINPKTNQVFFATGAEKTYWLNRWMDEGSYDKYKQSQGGKTPALSIDYKLEYTINGKTDVW